MSDYQGSTMPNICISGKLGRITEMLDHRNVRFQSSTVPNICISGRLCMPFSFAIGMNSVSKGRRLGNKEMT